MFFRLILSFFLLFTAAGALQAAQLQKIEHKTLAAGSEEVVLSFNAVTEPKVFTMGGEQPRIVFDFAGVEPRSTLRDLAPGAAVVKDIRLGIHRQGDVRTRLVFDVNSLQGMKHSYNVDEKNNRVIIRFSSADAPAAAREKPAQTAPARLQAGSSKKKGPGQDTAAKADISEKDVEKAAAPAARKQTEVVQAAATAPTPPSAAPQKPVAEAQKTSPPVEQTAVAVPPAEKSSSPVPAQPAQQAQAAAPPAATSEPATAAKKETAATAAPPAASAPAAPPKTLAVPSDAPYLSAIQFDPDSPRGELVQFKLNGFYPPVLRSIESGSPQVICEFSNLQVAPALEGPIKVSGRLVKAIRLDKSADGGKVRVFVELEPNQSYDLQQVFFKEDNFFVLIVNTVKA